MTKPRIALIGTGGTISSLGRDPFDVQDYITLGQMLDAQGVVDRFPEVLEVADVVPVAFPPIPSTQMGFAEWRILGSEISRLSADPTIDGIVILHGTASLEETAYALNLTVQTDLTVVLTGAQRPASGLATDGPTNITAAFRTAAAPAARGLGVLVCLNEEIQAAREVTKTSTWRLQTFRTPDFGILGHADAHGVEIYRRPVRRCAPDTEFDWSKLDTMPRVDISYCHSGADGTSVRAFVAAGARGIISAGFAPGMVTPAEYEALAEAAAAGITVVQSTRAGSGRVAPLTRLREAGILSADNLNPQKARILLALALSVTTDPAQIARMFSEY